MEKYYLYDIQNDERVFEVDDEVYWPLVGCIFNEEMLDTLRMATKYDDIGDEIDYLYYQLLRLKLPEDRIYKVIKIEVD